MPRVNYTRISLCAVTGGLVWFAWSAVVNLVGIGRGYVALQQSGVFLKEPRYSFFTGMWILMLFLLSYVVAWLYAGVRQTYGGGFLTALSLGLLVGFVAGFPMNFAFETWMPIDRFIPLWWMLELWVGCVLAALVSAWVYRD